MPTITGFVSLHDGSPVKGTLYARHLSALGDGTAPTSSSGVRAGVTASNTGTSLTLVLLTTGFYEFWFESSADGPDGNPVDFGRIGSPYRLEITGDTTLRAIRAAQPVGPPITPTLAEQAALSADRAEQAAASVQRDQPNGVAPLDSSKRVPDTNLPTRLATSALDAVYETAVRPEQFAASAGSGGTDTSALQACIDTGLPTLLDHDKTYRASGLVLKPGTVIRGRSRGSARDIGYSRIEAVGGDLFTTPNGGTSYTHYFGFENLMVFSQKNIGGHLFRGLWTQGSFRNFTAIQYNDDKSIFDCIGMIDVEFSGACELVHTLTSTVPAFKLVSSVGEIAQLDFGTLRCTNSGTKHFFHIEGTQGSVPINLDFRNVNFEICQGGAVKLVSARHVKFSRCGLWDFHTPAVNHLFHIAKSATSGAAPRDITFENCIRDASPAPGSGIYDIFAEPEAGMSELNVIDCGHQTTGAYLVQAGNSTGTVRGEGVSTLANGLRMSTDAWQVFPNPVVSGFTVGNGSIAARVRRRGRSTEYRVLLTRGSTSGFASSLLVQLPVQAVDGSAATSVMGRATDQGVNTYAVTGGLVSTEAAAVQVMGSGGVLSPVSNTAPFAWGAGDTLEFSIVYETAS